jgi:Zn-dependent M28 family amino/carboxypeptidase
MTPTSPAIAIGSGRASPIADNASGTAEQALFFGVETSLSPFASDHVPFIDAALPEVLTIEGADNANATVHSANDELEKIDYAFMLQILRMNVGFVANAVGLAV